MVENETGFLLKNGKFLFFCLKFQEISYTIDEIFFVALRR